MEGAHAQPPKSAVTKEKHNTSTSNSLHTDARLCKLDNLNMSGQVPVVAAEMRQDYRATQSLLRQEVQKACGVSAKRVLTLQFNHSNENSIIN